ncbi:DUF4065 domain-containing protein [Aequorivita todarodis]|uniref:type II toxin-antitoxin system antitoxin SocA domain-containing protein n=1 Tax=Aequorivita todarodis TaxID=2036821 RepID=UPI002350DE12|nr:type II toxin-antitoxin system antitoxin SocA domain-containing protein [Aequorivita todarodis]MDC7999743.1 DUF4065 domain-containing protein [Aequorivita todarodis]
MLKYNEKILVFEYIIHKLKDWFVEVNALNSIGEFNNVNDFSILKVVKLHFLVIAVNSNENDLLLVNHKFYAMPYGPVETDIYNRLKSGQPFTEFSINNFKTAFNENSQLPNIAPNYSTQIKNSIEKLRTISPMLINSDAGYLVDLTHNWTSWKITYSKARHMGTFSMPIESELIRNDNKILNTRLVF